MQLSQLQKESLKKNSGLCGIQTFDHCNSITNWDILIQASCEWLNLKTSSKQAICEFKELSWNEADSKTFSCENEFYLHENKKSFLYQ